MSELQLVLGSLERAAEYQQLVTDLKGDGKNVQGEMVDRILDGGELPNALICGSASRTWMQLTTDSHRIPLVATHPPSRPPSSSPIHSSTQNTAFNRCAYSPAGQQHRCPGVARLSCIRLVRPSPPNF